MISVIIPVYNAEKWIENCIDSLLAQSYDNFEILLVNDGSTDGSGELCARLADTNEKISFFNKENGGAASARNLGIDNAKGEYIAFIDADDTVHKDFLLKLHNAAVENKAQLVMCDFIKHTHDNSFPFEQPIRGGIYDKEQIKAELFPCLIMFDNLEFPPTISNCVCLFEHSLLKDNGIKYPEVRLCEDSYFGSVALYNANRFVYLKGQHLYNYLYHPSSVSHSFDSKKAEQRWDSFIKLNDAYGKYFCGKEAIFKKQIKYNMLYFTLNQLSFLNNLKLPLTEHVKCVKALLNEDKVRESLKDLKIPKVSQKLRLYIWFIKHRMAVAYCLTHRR